MAAGNCWFPAISLQVYNSVHFPPYAETSDEDMHCHMACWRYTGFTLSVLHSVHLFVCLWQNHVCSASFTIPARFVSYLHVLSNNITGFEISHVRSSETSKNDSRTSGIPAGVVRRTTAYFWFSHQLHISDEWMVHLDKWFLAATKQLYEWYFPSVRLSVCLSVCLSVTPFWLCSHHRIIMIFSGVITQDQGKVHAKGQGQRSKVKVTEVTTQLNRFRTVTPVWIHQWLWNAAQSLK